MRNLIVRKALSLGAALAAVGTLVAGPRVTVIGDSISAYGGTSIYAGYYPAHGVDSVDKMWWKIAIDAIGGELACDAAWSGSAVAGSGNDAMSSNHRLNKERLGANPDLFLICAGTNDGRGNKPLGEFTYDFTSVDRTKFRPAFAYMLNWLQTNYPEAKILVIVNTDVDKLLGTTDEHWEQYATSMETIAAHYGIASMRIHDVEKGVESYAQSPSGKVQVHPTAAGMVTFGNQVAAACQLLLAPPVQPRAELSVSAGTPGTLNVACHLTDAGVDATRATLSVGALPKGHEPSSIPVGTSVGELTAGGDWNGEISGLVPGYTYTVRMRLVNDLEAETNLFADCEVALAAADVAFTYTGASTSTRIADGRTAITLTSSGTLTLPAAVTLNDLLVVGGGGGGGGNLGGGGGAGGVVMKSDMGALIPADSYDVVIGGGGAGGVSGAWKGGNGSETSVSLGTVVESAPGGGGGATYGSNAGSDGGSGGGGAGGGYGSGGGVAGSATFDDVTAGHYGNSGGSGVTANFCGGGGGATQAGDAATSSAAGAGGKGITCEFTGIPVVYAGGGGGGSGDRALGGAGGEGGGGAGQALNNYQNGAAGTDGLGGGGGGGCGAIATGNGGNGGSGCVVLRLTPRGFVRIDKFYYRERDRRLDVAFFELEDPAADIDLYWTDGDYTSDYSLWTKVSSVGTCAAAKAVVTVDATARYIVFAVGSVYSRPLIVSELPNESAPLPEIAATLTLGQVTGGLQVQARVDEAGFAASTLTASFGVRAKGLCDPSEISLQPIASDWQKGTAWTNDVTGLVRGETYCVRLHLENDQGVSKDFLAEARVERAADGRFSFTYTGASTSTKLADGRTAITLTSSGTLTLQSAATLKDLLVVGGGGGGGGNLGGGGGAGGVVMKSEVNSVVAAGTYSVVVGAGGAGGNSGAWKGVSGDPTSIDLGTVSETAPGGGGGATYGSNAGLSGGSGGGGAGGGYGTGGGVAGPATFDDVAAGHYGKSGGNGVNSGAFYSGGGGGATQAGVAATGSAAGAGGKGISCDFTGIPVVYAGGGGGGSGNIAPGGAGGLGGGGAGQALGGNKVGAPGTDGLGGGGGGGGGSNASGGGGKGGSGCVVLTFTSVEALPLTKYYYRESSRRLIAEFAGIEDRAADIDLYWTDGDYTSDYSLWTKVPSVGTCAAAKAVVTVDATARYLVFAVGSSYSSPLPVSNLAAESEKLPEIEATLTLGRVSGGLRIRVNVEDIGFDATALTASYGVRKRDDGDPATIPLDLIATDWQTGTAWTNDVAGLDLGETYAVRLRLENDQGDVKELISTYELSAFCAQDYVRHGLIVQWDGVDNAGPGAHDAGATAWVDLCGNSTPFAGENLTFGDKYARLGNRLTSECSAIPLSYAPVTIEAYGFAETFVENSSTMLYIFSSGFGMSFYWQAKATYLGIAYVNNPTGKTSQNDGGGNGDLFSVPSHSALEANTWSLSQANSGRKVYVHGELGDFSGGKGYWFNNDVAFTRKLFAGDANTPTRIYSYRVYGHQLMDGEVAYNAAIDRIRFEGADPALEIAKLEPFGFRWNAGQSRVEVRLRAQCNRGALSVAEAWYPMEETVSVDYTPDGDGPIAWRGLPQGAVVSDDKRRVTFALTAGTDLAVEAHLVPAKTAYVTRGLIAQWDGIDNVGTGEYDAGATAWVDLRGNSTSFAGDALAFEFGAARAPDSAAFTATCSKLREGVYGPVTMECCGFATRYQSNDAAQNFFRCGAGCGLFYQRGSFGVKYVTNGAAGDTNCDGGGGGDSFSVKPHAITDHNTWTLSQADDSRKIYLRGIKGDFSAGAKGWRPGTATYSQAVTIGYASGGVDFCYHAVRVYDRQLSDAEIAYNAAIDRIRFEGASYSSEMAAVEAYGYRWNEERQRIEILITATGTRGEFKQDAIWCGIGEPVTFEFKTTQKGYRKVVWSGFDKENLVARQRGIATFVFTEPHTVTATAELGGDGSVLFVR